MTQPSIRFRLPLPLRLFSAMGDPLRQKIVPFTAEHFVRASKRITKLEDFGDDPEFIARIEAVVDRLNEVDFNLIGRFAVRTMMHWHLINRLHVVDLMKNQPELAEIDVSAPIVIVGLFRTGTTFLHNVMAADPALRAGKMWEVSYPVGRKRDPLGDFKWRKRRTAIPLTMNHTIVPDQDVVHYVSSDAYEEDFFLLGSDLAMMTQFVGLGDWPYAWDLLNKDLRSAYDWHKLQLQILTAQRSADRWLLKCPWHLWNHESLLEVYPNAKVIHIHRDIVKAIGSQCSLAGRIVGRMHRNADLGELADFWVEYSHAGLERGQIAKDRLPPNQLVDVGLKELRANPIETLRQIHAQLELPFNESLISEYEQVADNGPTAQYGVHDYRIEDFGLEPDAVRDKFAAYSKRFGL